MFFLGIFGKTKIMIKTIARFNIAAITYTDLHPHKPAIIPLANLENRIPVVIPEDTIPQFNLIKHSLV